MTTFPGVATLKEDNVPVMVGLDDEKITLVSGEVSIGEWLAGQYEVIDLGAGEFVIEAEDDSIPFVPDDPSSFALGIQRDTETPAAAARPLARSTRSQGGTPTEAGHRGRLLGARRHHRRPRHLGDAQSAVEGAISSRRGRCRRRRRRGILGYPPSPASPVLPPRGEKWP